MKRAPQLQFDADVVVHRSADPLLAAEVAFFCLHGNVPEKELNLVQFSARCVAQLRARTPQIMGATWAIPSFLAYCFTTCQTTRFVTPSPQCLPARQTHRNSLPAEIPAAAHPKQFPSPHFSRAVGKK